MGMVGGRPALLRFITIQPPIKICASERDSENLGIFT